MKLRSTLTAVILALVLFSQACGGGSFANNLRVILAASGPLINSLNLGDKRSAVIADFTELANGAATLKTELDACADKPCKVTAVERYEQLFERVEARGHFGSHPKLQTIEGILRGIIASAKVYYGGSTSGPESAMSAEEAGKDVDAKVKQLKAEMKVK